VFESGSTRGNRAKQMGLSHWASVQKYKIVDRNCHMAPKEFYS